MTADVQTLCPSAQHDALDAKVFAVVAGTPESPETAYLDRAHAVTDELIKMAEPVAPAEVFRFAATCLQKRCGHFDEGKQHCRLVTKTVSLQQAVVARLPRCAIRSSCRWWQQEGMQACLRCPQVVTNNYAATESARAAADITHIPNDDALSGEHAI